MSIQFQKLVVGSLSVLIAIYVNKFKERDKNIVFPQHPIDYSLPEIKEYDFIIVGAGSAGSPVANKLSKKFTVLLLEVGVDPVPQLYVPNMFGFIRTNPNVMHLWQSVKQSYSTLDTDGITFLAQGKSLGGTHAVNGLNYNRGNPKDYDNWAKLTKDNSWNYKNVLKYFKMTENFVDEENENGELGVGGPVTMHKDGNEFQGSYDAFINAAKELGYNSYENSNSPQIPGFGKTSRTIRFGRRVSVYDAFLKPILKRKNLDISRSSYVSRIDINENNRAIGVYYNRYGVEHYAKAKLEIIISAGTMNSPMILLRSGIGPADKLKALGIRVRSDLPVGENFQDHPNSRICGKYSSSASYPLKNFGPKDITKYLTTGKGFLTNIAGEVSQGFVVSSIAKSNGQFDWPDMQLTLYNNFTLYVPNADDKSICIVTYLTRVTSRGSVFLDPTNVMNPAIWNPNYLEEITDTKILAEGVKISSKFFKTDAFKSFGVSLQDKIHPACKNYEFNSDAYWQCYVRQDTLSTSHPVGTCKMGRKDDRTSVVDTKLQVIGIHGVRVIDNSIQPTITNSNANAPAIMIGQKGVHMILAKYR